MTLQVDSRHEADAMDRLVLDIAGGNIVAYLDIDSSADLVRLSDRKIARQIARFASVRQEVRRQRAIRLAQIFASDTRKPRSCNDSDILLRQSALDTLRSTYRRPGAQYSWLQGKLVERFLQQPVPPPKTEEAARWLNEAKMLGPIAFSYLVEALRNGNSAKQYAALLALRQQGVEAWAEGYGPDLKYHVSRNGVIFEFPPVMREEVAAS